MITRAVLDERVREWGLRDDVVEKDYVLGEASGIDFSVQEPRVRLRPGGRTAEGRVYYRGPRGAPTPARIKLDLSAEEVLARPPVLRSIAHAYPDELPAPAQVRCYAFEELFAEKIRAMGERSRPRDLYDIVNLFRREDLRLERELIHSTLERKCESKGIDLPTHKAVRDRVRLLGKSVRSPGATARGASEAREPPIIRAVPLQPGLHSPL